MNKILNISAVCLLCSASLLSSHVYAVTAEFSINVIVTAPCSLSVVNAAVDFGALPYGDKAHTQFAVKVDCDRDISTHITASVVTGTLKSDNYKIGMTSTEGRAGSSVMWLTSNGDNVDLSGGVQTNVPLFCKGENTRTCLVTPHTYVGLSAPMGDKVKAAIRLTMTLD